ncbi:MAG: hypothetical protein V4591_08980 [Bdellovibrionota bacterium]
MNTRPILLIIDPALNSPCTEALNCILEIMGEFKNNLQFAFSHCEYVCPFLNKIKLKDCIRNKNIGAVICLGSIANVTDQFPFVQEFIADLEAYLFEKNTPFFGICFGHQIFAEIHGFKVHFLKKRHLVPMGKHHIFRMFEVIHPKLSLLATKFQAQDYFSENKIDLSFKYTIKETINWNKNQWNLLSTHRDWTLTAVENRVKEHIKNYAAKNIISQARHEQEVWESRIASDVVLAGSSQSCEFEALVHSSKPFYTVQTHPETRHESRDGYLLLKNFIYTSSLLLTRCSSQ